ncbi:hypothetical protein H4219_005822 [Mycoemilia scoparia]|uniref:Rab proteins geranylgeranyltransferase component A n=1 Tax=Mycoemilia scoparia TaxID=417184 RepID=A0A9W7ZS91_9FUNG|nr:hypothetical protein H4219_005822 [Mycoemilia scoparia]
MADSVDLDKTDFDAVIIGTGVTEAIVAGSLGRAGKSVLHIDKNPFYGGISGALDLSQLFSWIDQLNLNSYGDSSIFSQFDIGVGDITTKISIAQPNTQQEVEIEDIIKKAAEKLDPIDQRIMSRNSKNMAQLISKYDIALKNNVSDGSGNSKLEEFVEGLIPFFVDSRRYSSNMIYWNGVTEKVPDSKGDIFASQSLSLIEKRKLMKFLTFIRDNDPEDHVFNSTDAGQETTHIPTLSSFVAKNFKIEGKLQAAVVHSIAFADNEEEVDARVGCLRIRKYLQSIGRYGKMAYLYSPYGVGSETSQAFCRACAVSGHGVYMLESGVKGIKKEDGSANKEGSDKIQINVNKVNQTITTKNCIVSAEQIRLTDAPQSQIRNTVSRGILILDKPLYTGTNLVTIPPGQCNNRNAVFILTTCANGACPQGKAIMYVWTKTSSSLPKGSSSPRQDLMDAISGVLASKSQQPSENSKDNRQESSNNDDDNQNQTAEPKVLLSIFYKYNELQETTQKEDHEWSADLWHISTPSSFIDIDDSSMVNQAYDIFVKITGNTEKHTFLPPNIAQQLELNKQ